MIEAVGLFDTNAFIAALNREPAIKELARRFESLAITGISVGELRFGAMNSNRPLENRAEQDRRLRFFQVLHTTDSTPDHYARIRLSLDRRGSRIPANDLWIAALAIENNLPRVTRDAHFASVEGLTVLGF